jgi:hypothetical protein
MVGLAMIATVAFSACSVESDTSGPDGVGDNRVKASGSGRVVEESRKVSSFTGISLYSDGQVTNTLEALTIETDDNLMEYLETTVIDGILDIRVRESTDVDLDPTNGIKFDITVADLDGVELHGAGTFDIGVLTTDRLELTINGAGDFSIGNLEANEVEVVLAGSGSIVLAGQVGTERLELLGAGDLDTSGMSAERVTVGLSGVGDVSVWATDQLDVIVAGIGDVGYYGNPSVTQLVTGSGTVSHKGNKWSRSAVPQIARLARIVGAGAQVRQDSGSETLVGLTGQNRR